MLTLRRNRAFVFPTYDVMSGAVRLGEIHRHVEAPTEQWACHLAPIRLMADDVQIARSSSLERATGEFRSRWEQWVAAADLIERSVLIGTDDRLKGPR